MSIWFRLGGQCLWARPPAGTVDHFALSIEGFNEDAVKRTLEQRGYTARQDDDSGFHVKDPDGANVQLTP